MAEKLSSAQLELASARAHTPESFARALVQRLSQQAAAEVKGSPTKHEMDLKATVRLVQGARGFWCVWACICGPDWCEGIIICGGFLQGFGGTRTE